MIPPCDGGINNKKNKVEKLARAKGSLTKYADDNLDCGEDGYTRTQRTYEQRGHVP